MPGMHHAWNARMIFVRNESSSCVCLLCFPWLSAFLPAFFVSLDDILCRITKGSMKLVGEIIYEIERKICGAPAAGVFAFCLVFVFWLLQLSCVQIISTTTCSLYPSPITS